MKLWMKVATFSIAILIQPVAAAEQELLNASYDIARELYAGYNELFVGQYKAQTGEDVTIKQSHAGSSRQAQAILQGLRADVVTFNQVTDIDILHERGNLVPENWAERLPNQSSPFYSTMAFLVHKDNPKNIRNWDDLVREGVELVMPNPKTSGNGRYTYLAALGYAQATFGEDQEKIDEFLGTLLARVKVFDTGGRGATTTFIERGIGDALLTFESEVLNIAQNDDRYIVITPDISFFAEFPVTWVDRNVERNGTEALAKAYLEGLYTEEAQRLIAGYNYRILNETVQKEYADRFRDVTLVPIQDIAGSWEEAMEVHFSSGGKLDQLQRQ